MGIRTSLQLVDQLVPGSNIEAYIQSVSAIVLLSAEQEQNLAERLYYKNDLEAARQLVMSHLRFVVHIARSYSGYDLPLSDLIQEGNVGLMKAVKRFDPKVGVRLVSFAVHWVKAEIHEYILKNWRIVKVATTKAQRKLFFNLRSSKKCLSWLTNDEVTAVANNLGVEARVVREMESRMAGQDTDFDGYIDDNDDSTAYVTPAHYLEDQMADPARLLEDSNWSESSINLLENALDILDKRSRDILEKRWLNNKKATLHELADKYGVSAERIRQLEKNAMKKVKGSMEIV